MAFTDKDDAITHMDNNITDNIQPHLTPVLPDNKISANNLKNWLKEFMAWMFPTSGTPLKGTSPVVTSNTKPYENIVWQQLVPIGTVMPWAGSGGAPDGYLLCDGSLASGTTYLDLYNVIGDNYGSPSGGSFRLPNLKGRVPLGLDSASSNTPANLTTTHANVTNYKKVGNTGGLQKVALKTSELAKHTHDVSLNTNTKGNHNHRFTYSGDHDHLDHAGHYILGRQNPDVNLAPYGASAKMGMADAGNHSHTVSGATRDTGSNTGHENRMPYVVMQYIIKT